MRPTLLLIDDSPEIHRLIEVRLRPEGLRLEHALGGEQGVSMAESLRPDLILLDVDIPDVSGFDVCRRLKADPETAGIPIIFLTGASDIETKVHGFDLGATDYVTKPFVAAELRARVRAALRTKRYLDLLETRASIDGLTGVSTRRCFDERITAEVASANTERSALSLVMLDIDHFKRLNDDFGHPFGDQVLTAVGEMLLAERGRTDSVYRYGGEEFAVLLSGIGLTEAVARAEALRDRVRALAFTAGREAVRVTASFGVAMGQGGALTAARLVRSADRALYAAKRDGRDRVVASTAACGRATSLPPPP